MKKIISITTYILLIICLTGCTEKNRKVEDSKVEIEQKENETISCEEGYELKENECIKIEPEKEYFTVIFDSKGGTTIEAVKVEKNNKVNTPAPPTRSGYTFSEWQLNNKKFDFDTEITNDITLIAIWKKNSTANTNNNSTNSSNKNENHNANQNITNNQVENNNQNINNNNSQNNVPEVKTCDEEEKRRETERYNSVKEKIDKSISDFEKQKADSQALLNKIGGYISEIEYESEIKKNPTASEKAILASRLQASKLYDGAINYLNELNQTLIDTTKVYNDRLKSMNCQ